MLFRISLAFTDTFANVSRSSSSEDGSVGYCDISRPKTKHWKVVIASSARARIIELTTPDWKTILITNKEINRHTYNELPMLNKYQVARYDGNEEDFDCVLRHHPMRGRKCSVTFNNCQHFAANFLLLLEALAKEDHQKSFKGTEYYRTVVSSVMKYDEVFLWNKPNLYLLSYVGLAVAEAAAEATVKTETTTPATGTMGWLGAAPTVTVTTPAAAATFAGVFTMMGAGTMCAYTFRCISWKRHMKMKHPLVSGFPSGDKPKLSASELS